MAPDGELLVINGAGEVCEHGLHDFLVLELVDDEGNVVGAHL